MDQSYVSCLMDPQDNIIEHRPKDLRLHLCSWSILEFSNKEVDMAHYWPHNL